MLNTVNVILSALSTVSNLNTKNDVLNDDISIDVYTENSTVYADVVDALENLGAVEDVEKTDTLNDFVAPDEDISYMVYVLNNVVITVQLNMM